MTVNETLALYSNYLVYGAMAAFTVSMIAFAASFAAMRTNEDLPAESVPTDAEAGAPGAGGVAVGGDALQQAVGHLGGGGEGGDGLGRGVVGFQDGGGGGGITTVTISGKATYQRVPFSTNANLGLSYASTSEQPVREAIVELIQSGGNTLATTTTDDNGNYSLTAPANTSVFVRVQAQSRRTTTAARSIRVLNNTNGNALYVLDSATFSSGVTNQTKNLLAGSGWGGTSYTGTRSAAPFAILDTLLASAQFVVANGNSTLDLPGRPAAVDWTLPRPS